MCVEIATATKRIYIYRVKRPISLLFESFDCVIEKQYVEGRRQRRATHQFEKASESDSDGIICKRETLKTKRGIYFVYEVRRFEDYYLYIIRKHRCGIWSDVMICKESSLYASSLLNCSIYKLLHKYLN